MKIKNTIKENWNILNLSQKKYVIAAYFLATTMAFSGCGTKKNNDSEESRDFLGGYENVTEEELKLQQIAMKYECSIDDIEIIYTKKGDTLSAIANKYNMSLADLISINDIEDPDMIDQNVPIIVINKSLTNDLDNDNSNSLEDIAKKYGCTVNDFEYVHPKVGDNLTLIANRYGMELDDLISINNIKNVNHITTEMKIKVLSSTNLNNQNNNGFYRESYDINIFNDNFEKYGYIKGIDISQSAQGNINLKKVLQSNPVDFVMVRAGYCIVHSKCDKNYDFIDDNFYEYARVCAEMGVPMGVYFWPSIVDVESAKREVEAFINALNKIKEDYGLCLQFPVAIDIELPNDQGGQVIPRLNSGDQDSIDALNYVIDALKENGYYPMIYTGHNALATNPNYKKIVESLEIDAWIPRYKEGVQKIENKPDIKEITAYDKFIGIQQYSQEGALEGYNGSLDLDICHVNYPALIKEMGLNGFETENDDLFSNWFSH